MISDVNLNFGGVEFDSVFCAELDSARIGDDERNVLLPPRQDCPDKILGSTRDKILNVTLAAHVDGALWGGVVDVGFYKPNSERCD